jgi:hypothetical protein
MKYVVTWGAYAGMETFLTIIDGDQALTIDDIMDWVCVVEEVDPDLGYQIYSIVRADNVDVIF